MIGPSSGASEMPKREVDENPVRLKRKVFEDLDIERFCDEVCQNAKKCNLIGCEEIDMSDMVEFSSPSTPLQETANSGSVAKVEVFVVDGPWDVSNLNGSELIDISSTMGHNSEISIGQSVENVMENMDNGYGTILSYWESAAENFGTSMIENREQQPEIPEFCPSPVSNLGVSMSCNLPEDQENGNLSWLLDFKLDSLIEAPEDKGTISFPKNNQTGPKIRNQSNNTQQYINDIQGNNNNESDESAHLQAPISSNYSSMANRNFSVSRYGGPKKPPFTYTELIEHALKEKGELTVSAIYQWISEHFPYYKSNDDRWKNSVRHNLSINPHFRKGSKAPHGAGHLWAIANRGDTRPRQLITLQNAAAVPTIQRQAPKTTSDSSHTRKNATNDSLSRRSIPVDEVASATASISQLPEENHFISVTLEHCAEQILNGIKKDVEVQYLVPMAMQNNTQPESNLLIPKSESTCLEKETERDCWNVLTDFLNPVSKEVVAEECGLISEGYIVSDLNSSTLGLSLTESEISTSENLFGEELSFQFYELTSPSQIQSA